MNKHLAYSMFGATLVLAGCGGGDDSPPPPGPTQAVPASASTSSVGLTSYLVALSTSSADNLEPLSLDNFNPVQPDNTEPEVVN